MVQFHSFVLFNISISVIVFIFHRNYYLLFNMAWYLFSTKVKYKNFQFTLELFIIFVTFDGERELRIPHAMFNFLFVHQLYFGTLTVCKMPSACEYLILQFSKVKVNLYLRVHTHIFLLCVCVCFFAYFFIIIFPAAAATVNIYVGNICIYSS